MFWAKKSQLVFYLSTILKLNQLFVHLKMISKKRKLARVIAIHDLFSKLEEETEERKKPKRLWSKQWLLQRDLTHSIYQDIEGQGDYDKFNNAFRMYPEAVDEILKKIGPKITKQRSNFREPIHPRVRLLVTLRYLSGGCNYTLLEDLFRIARSTMSRFIPEVGIHIILCFLSLFLIQSMCLYK